MQIEVGEMEKTMKKNLRKDLRDAKLRGADFSNATFIGIKLIEAINEV